MDRNVCCRHFSTRHFVLTYMHDLKTKGCINMIYLTSNCSTFRDIYFWFRTVCEIRQVSYGSKYASKPYSNMTLVCTSTCYMETTGCIQTYTSNDCSIITDIYFLFQSWMRDTTGEQCLQTFIAWLSHKPFVRPYTQLDNYSLYMDF